MNHLDKKNCNKAKCKTCMFNYNENSVKLSPERLEEIHSYLIKGKSSHVCHITNKTCYGGLELQAKVLHKMNIIKEPTVDCLLATAKKVLDLK